MDSFQFMEAVIKNRYIMSEWFYAGEPNNDFEPHRIQTGGVRIINGVRWGTKAFYRWQFLRFYYGNCKRLDKTISKW